MVWSSALKGIIVLAHRLKQARLRAGLSQEKLGKLSGIDPMSASARMNQYERGKHSPDYHLMCRVAEILQMPVSWFYTEDEEHARLQEIYHHLSPAVRQSLVNHAEEALAGNPNISLVQHPAVSVKAPEAVASF